ncbi:hypothetical protein V6R21_09900 [Limibacter armeniacum]|uniref:hypothetical protein n=1 Tax=Limibacter armeniacum TaxID=466084 RepID=UPI002FE68A83
MRHFSLIIYWLLSIFVFSCSTFEGAYDDTLTIEEGSYSTIDDRYLAQQDPQPNLLLTNDTDYDLYLYVKGQFERIIPSHSYNFGVAITTTGIETINLKLYKAEDLSKEEVSAPSSDKIFKQWDAVLSSNSYDAVSWVIDNSEGELEKSIVNFEYPIYSVDGNTNTYSVDVYLNGETGTKLASFNPAGSGKIALDYGYQVLIFKYWVSDKSTNAGIEEIGWVKHKPNGTTYSVVANNANKEIDFEIPLYFNEYDNEKTGFLNIQNSSSYSLLLKANGQLLEDFIIQQESTKGMSYIGSTDSNASQLTVKLPVGEILLQAVRPESGSVIKSESIEINEGETTTWLIQ